MANENIIFLGDLHIGAPTSLFDQDADEIPYQQLLSKLNSLGDITKLVLLGDIFDFTMAPINAIWGLIEEFWYNFFYNLTSEPDIFYIPGNHDHHLLTIMAEHKAFVKPILDHIHTKQEDNDFISLLEQPHTIEYFTPDDNTIIHALFPEKVRDRLIVKYPFYDFPIENKIVYAHHGHYFDRTITPLAKRAAEHMELIEEYNAPLLEGLFYFSSLGRSSTDSLGKLYKYYKIIIKMLNILKPKDKYLFKKTEFVGGLPLEFIRFIMSKLYGDNYNCVVFGHKHKPEQKECEDGKRFYSIGGWIIDGSYNTVKGYTTSILQMLDNEITPHHITIEDSVIRKMAAKWDNSYK